MRMANTHYSAAAAAAAVAPSPASTRRPIIPLEPLQIRNSVLTHNHLWWGFAVAFVTLCVGALFYFCLKSNLISSCKQRWKRQGKLDAKKMMLRRFQLEELEKATNNFSQECLVGSGAFGNVYRGMFGVEGTLAIKKAHADPYISKDEFRNEVRLLSKVKHRNLVGLVGFCEEPGRGGRTLSWNERVNIAIGAAKENFSGFKSREILWCPSSSCKTQLESSAGVILQSDSANCFATDNSGNLELENIINQPDFNFEGCEKQNTIMACKEALLNLETASIAYLHEGMKPSIIHRDIKPSNILVGEGFEAKVSDFGLVKSGPIGDQSHVSSQIKGTPGYLDPAYCSSFHLSPFSDVYSFGVILLQLVTARPAVEINRSRSNYHIIEWARPSLEQGNVENIIDANLLSENCNMRMMVKMGQLGLRCVVKVPKDRPTMTQVWQELEAALHSSDNFIPKHPSKGPTFPSRSIGHGTSRQSMDINDCSQSFVSIDGVGLQRFHVDMDSISLHSASLRCFETSSISIDIDNNILRGICEETTSDDYYEDMDISLPRD
ncbi:unnamed protein product [Camellia sinensis]